MNQRAIGMIVRMGMRAFAGFMAKRAEASEDPKDRARAQQARQTTRQFGQAQRLMRMIGRR